MIVQGQEQFFKNMSNRKSVLDDIPDSNEIDVKINNEFINDQALKKYGTSRQDFVPEGSQWFPRMRNSEPKGGDGDADSLNSYSSVKYFFWCVNVCTKPFFAKKGSKIKILRGTIQSLECNLYERNSFIIDHRKLSIKF